MWQGNQENIKFKPADKALKIAQSQVKQTSMLTPTKNTLLSSKALSKDDSEDQKHTTVISNDIYFSTIYLVLFRHWIGLKDYKSPSNKSFFLTLSIIEKYHFWRSQLHTSKTMSK